MAEACKVVSLGAPLCHEEACVRRGDDHSYAASISGASSGSLCSSASDLSDHATSSPPDHSSEVSSASPSTLQLDSEGPLYELSSLIAQLPVRCIFCPPRPCNKMIAKKPSKGSFACLLSRASSTSLLYSSAKLLCTFNMEIQTIFPSGINLVSLMLDFNLVHMKVNCQNEWNDIG